MIILDSRQNVKSNHSFVANAVIKQQSKVLCAVCTGGGKYARPSCIGQGICRAADPDSAEQALKDSVIDEDSTTVQR